MNTIIIILLIIVVALNIKTLIHNHGIHIEWQFIGIYIIWYTWEHNAFGEYYKLTHRTCIWKFQQKQ